MGWVMVIFLIGFMMFGESGFFTQFRLWREGRRLRQQIQREKEHIQNLKKEVELLTHDLQYLKEQARKKGLAAEDEILILLDKP